MLSSPISLPAVLLALSSRAMSVNGIPAGRSATSLFSERVNHALLLRRLSNLRTKCTKPSQLLHRGEVARPKRPLDLPAKPRSPCLAQRGVTCPRCGTKKLRTDILGPQESTTCASCKEKIYGSVLSEAHCKCGKAVVQFTPPSGEVFVRCQCGKPLKGDAGWSEVPAGIPFDFPLRESKQRQRSMRP